MKNKLLFITLFLTTNAGFCETTARTAVVHSAIIKFALAMLGVLVSSFIIYAGLAIYNKFFVEQRNIKFSPEQEILKTPKNIDEAIKFFINKNSIK